MKKSFLFLALLAGACYGSDVSQYRAYYIEQAGGSPQSLHTANKMIFFVAGGGALLPDSVYWPSKNPLGLPRPTEGELPSLVEATAIIEGAEAAKQSARNSAKSSRLKAAENRLIEFLRDEGAIDAGAVSATAEHIDAMYDDWEATLNDAQLEKKFTKYARILQRVERAGGTELDCTYHE